jgi:macrodomain Ter protein organizer (MatP/YcbG family)
MMAQALKEIEPYRAKEKSIGIPIIVNHNNFFNKSEEERYCFLKQSILQKIDLLAEVVKKKKLDTNMERLRTDLQQLLG